MKETDSVLGIEIVRSNGNSNEYRSPRYEFMMYISNVSKNSVYLDFTPQYLNMVQNFKEKN